MGSYTHLLFRKNWMITESCAIMLGECKAIVEVLKNTPLRPKERERLHGVSLVKVGKKFKANTDILKSMMPSKKS